MKLAYIAGPFRASNAWQRAQNIREAEQVGMAVTCLGVMPIIPHANNGNFDGTLNDAFWLEGTKEMMRRCDLVVCTERWHASTGAKDEVKEAHRLNIPAYVKIGACYYPILNDGFPALSQRLDPWELKAIIEADWKREVTIDPSTNSISATLTTCSAPVPEIIRVHPTGTGDHGSIDVTTGDGLTRYAVQQVLGKSLRNVSVEELAKLGLKPSQPEPPPTGNGDLVTAASDDPVGFQNAPIRYLAKGRETIDRIRDELGDDGFVAFCIGNAMKYEDRAGLKGDAESDLLKARWYRAMVLHVTTGADDPRSDRSGFQKYHRMEAVTRHAHKLDMLLMEYVEAVRDVTTGSKPASRARAEELYTAIKQDMLEGDPRMGTVERMREMMGPAPTLHPRPFFWESNMCHGPVNCPEGTWGNRMTLEQLLQYVPNALDGKETHHKQEPGCPPIFGFRFEHTGPRTLREYLEAP